MVFPLQSPLRVLYVEDDILVASVGIDALQELGFQTVEAHSAKAALAIAEAEIGNIDVAVIDVGLPDGRGDQLAMDIRRLRPNLPIIIATGYGEASLSDELRGTAAVSILRKPYDTALLQEAFEKLGLG